MASFTITVPDAVVPRVADAVAATFAYDAERDGTKAQFTKKVLVDYLRRLVQEHEARLAQQAAADKVAAEVVLS